MEAALPENAFFCLFSPRPLNASGTLARAHLCLRELRRRAVEEVMCLFVAFAAESLRLKLFWLGSGVGSND